MATPDSRRIQHGASTMKCELSAKASISSNGLPSGQPSSIDDGKNSGDIGSEDTAEGIIPYFSQRPISWFLLRQCQEIAMILKNSENQPSRIQIRQANLPSDCIAKLALIGSNSRRPQLMAVITANIPWKPCRQLKYYKQRAATSARVHHLTEPQSLNFRDKEFSTNGLPSEIPEAIRNMKLEENRLRSFLLGGKDTFQAVCTFIQPEDLAANGFFYMQTGDKVKCAFCLGLLSDWQLGETPVTAHQKRYSTCPLILGIEVGNVPLLNESELPAPAQCSEESDCTENPWILKLPTSDNSLQDLAPLASRQCLSQEPLDSSDELAYQLLCQPALPVSAEAAIAACRPSAVTNLEVLSRSLEWRRAQVEYAPAEPKLASTEDRAATFVDGLAVPSDLLADAGFYYCDSASQCYWCSLRVNFWRPGDDPWIEHARWSPRCCHLLLSRGHEFVLASRSRHPPYLPSGVSREAKAASHEPRQNETLSASVVDYRIEQRHFKARDDLPPSLLLKRLGFEPTDIKTTQFVQLKSCGDDFMSSEVFASSVMNIQREREAKNMTAAQFNEQKVKELEEKRNRQPKELGDNDLNWKACKVCMDKIINVTLLGCKHLCCCSICAKALQTCPVCRADIKALVYINLD